MTLDIWLLPLRVLGFLMWTKTEHGNARWLPWWRRYLALLPLLAWVANAFQFVTARPCLADWILSTTGVAIGYWNCHTADKNRRNRRDMRALESRAELTAVQERSFGREVAEAVS